MRPATYYYLAQFWSPARSGRPSEARSPGSGAVAATRVSCAATTPDAGCRPSRAGSSPC